MTKGGHKRPLTSEKLGEKGENRFKELCTDAGLIANKSDIDAMGWDYLIEFPYPAVGAEGSLDKRTHPIECKIQIKTVWADTTDVSLKLSAAERLTKSAKPSFIVVLSVNGLLNFTAMHIFHMLDDHMAHVLKRLRTATERGSLKINLLEISFAKKNGDTIDFSGKGLSEYIAAACGPDINLYHEKKSAQLLNLGYKPRRYEGTFSVKAKDRQELARIFLGLRDAELLSFTTSETRFDIKLPHISTTAGTVKISPMPVGDCRLMLIGKAGGSAARLQGSVYLPPFRDPGEIIFRVSTPLLDLLFNNGECDIETRISESYENEIPLGALKSSLEFHAILVAGGGTISIFAPQKIFSGSFDSPLDESFGHYVAYWLDLITATNIVFSEANCQDRTVSFSSLAQHAPNIEFLSRLIADESSIKIDPMRYVPDPGTPLPEVSEALLIGQLIFPRATLAFYAVMGVSFLEKDGSIVVEVGSVSLRELCEIDRNEASFRAYCEEAQSIAGICMSLVMNPSEMPELETPTPAADPPTGL
jgi:hypothetical protein